LHFKRKIIVQIAVTLASYVGFCVYKLCGPISGHLQLQVADLPKLFQLTALSLLNGIAYIYLLFRSPNLFLVTPAFISAIICAWHYRPRKPSKRHILLLSPLLGAFPIAGWGAYVSIARQNYELSYLGLKPWVSTILASLFQAAFIPIATILVFHLIDKETRSEILFAFSILTLIGCLIYLQYLAATMPTANSWL